MNTLSLCTSGSKVTDLDGLVGLGKLKERIVRAVVSCRIRGDVFPHTLLTGLGGTGKTTIARAISNELGYYCVETEAAELKSRGHVIEALLKANDSSRHSFLFFIDEIHRLSLDRQEALYIPMKENVVNRGVDKVVLKPWTLIGATTRRDLLDEGSFISRFQNVWDIGRYSLYDIERIVESEMSRQGLRCGPSERTAIAKRCLGIPRQAINLVAKVRDQVLYVHPTDLVVRRKDVQQTFFLEEIDEIGLGPSHILYLMALLQSQGKPKGLAVLSAQLGCNKVVVEDTIEPILISLGMISATPKGRVLTEKGYRHLATQGLA